MRIRILLGMLLAVAMSFAPLAMAGEQAMAAAPSHHAEMDAGAAHCPEQSGQDQPDNPDAKPCCAAGCTAAAALPELMAQPPALPKPQLRPAAEQFHRSTLSEIATPPPRFS